MNKEYKTVIGLEIHIELKTKSKCFCACENSFGGAPNTHCCPVCTALPGALPVLNKEAVLGTIRAGLSLGCDINNEAVFERKNYFYPDLAKAYQISQLVKPICLGGGIQTAEGFVRLNRIHLEEDAGKLVHEATMSLIDYNRAGVPLIEIVTEPDIRSKEQAIEFLTKLRQTIIYSGVAECKMEEGGMRCDVNLSIMKKGSEKFNKRTEMKNLNSFKSVERAIIFEEKRQREVMVGGGLVVQETRRWDDALGESFSMRDKEESADYRYFPDPDLLTVIIKRETIEELKATLPLSPEARREKYINEYKLPKYDADVLIADIQTVELFDKTNEICKNPKAVSNFIMTEIMAKVKEGGSKEIKITAENLAELIILIESKKLTRTIGKELLSDVWENGGSIKKLVIEKNLISNISNDEIESIINNILKLNEKAVADHPLNADKVLRFFVGQVMKETKGKANAELVSAILKQKLEG